MKYLEAVSLVKDLLDGREFFGVYGSNVQRYSMKVAEGVVMLQSVNGVDAAYIADYTSVDYSVKIGADIVMDRLMIVGSLVDARALILAEAKKSYDDNVAKITANFLNTYGPDPVVDVTETPINPPDPAIVSTPAASPVDILVGPATDSGATPAQPEDGVGAIHKA